MREELVTHHSDWATEKTKHSLKHNSVPLITPTCLFPEICGIFSRECAGSATKLITQTD